MTAVLYSTTRSVRYRGLTCKREKKVGERVTTRHKIQEKYCLSVAGGCGKTRHFHANLHFTTRPSPPPPLPSFLPFLAPDLEASPSPSRPSTPPPAAIARIKFGGTPPPPPLPSLPSFLCSFVFKTSVGRTAELLLLSLPHSRPSLRLRRGTLSCAAGGCAVGGGKDPLHEFQTY